MPDEKNKQLINSINLLCDFVRDSLPQGWEITLSMSSEEASIELTDPLGDAFDVDSDGCSILTAMCEYAKEVETNLEGGNRDGIR